MGKGVQRPFKGGRRESAGKHHVTAALLKELLDGTSGPESQQLSGFGEDSIRAKVFGKNWARSKRDK